MTSYENEQSRLNNLVEAINRLNSTESEELFKLLQRNECEYTRNNNGVFLNLSWLNKEMICELEHYVNFCHASRKEIQHYENICENLSNDMMAQSLLRVEAAANFIPKKDSIANANANGTELDKTAGTSAAEKQEYIEATRRAMASKVTPSMKFYLLKKKYGKTLSFDTNAQSDLEKEDYISV